MPYIFTLLFLCTTLFASHSSESKLTPVSLQLHWKYQFEFAGFIAAKEKGFYKDAGLNVTLKEYKDGINIEKEVVSGASNYGIYNSNTLVDFLKGEQIKLVASFFKRAALVLITKPDIHSPRDLVGKKVMGGTADDFRLNFQAFFEGYGVHVEDVKLVKHTYNINDFVEGKVSAVSAFLSDQLSKLDEKGIQYNILDPSDENLFVLQMELFTSFEEAQNHPQRVEAFKNASIKGWQYALSHKKELIDIIYKKYSKDISKKDLALEAQAIEKLILPYTYTIGSIDKNFLSKQIKLFQKYYKVGLNKQVEDFIFQDSASTKSLYLTEEERSFIATHIATHKKVTLCTQYDLLPIDGSLDTKHIGVMSDIYNIITKKTGLEFDVLSSSSKESLKTHIQKKQCDILSVYSSKVESSKFLKPTKSFATTSFTLISELDKSFSSRPSLLKGKILLTQFEWYKKYLLSLYPYLIIHTIEDKNKMIETLLHDEAYAIITLDDQADYLISKYGYGKLKINGFLAKEEPLELSVGVQKDELLLYQVVQKALKSIPQKVIQSSMNRWRMTRYESREDYSLIFTVLGVMSLILVIMIYYQKKLRNFNTELENLVNEKTRALREINEYLEETVAQKVDELIQKDEILTVQSKQAVMGEMISMIAHQWRQPLNTITLKISNLQIQQMMGKEINATELNSAFDEINSTIGYLSETVDDFKTYFHPDKEKEVVEIDELLSKAINFVLPRAKAEGIKLGITQPSTIEMQVYPNELIQVLLNIFNNAIDVYMQRERNDKFIEVYAENRANEVWIYIKDQAGGIKQEHLGKLFEPYFSTKGKNGTGLGLYMSQMIIEKQFSGKIQVQTQGETTSFIIQIP